jgi:hypothetical protein
MARHVQNTALRFQEYLIEAGTLPKDNRKGKLAYLNKADTELTKLRFLLRLCRDLSLLNAGQHHHVNQMIDEIGRLLGGWFRSLGAVSQQQLVLNLPQ